MKAQTAEIEREDGCELLIPTVHVERSITRATTILSIEIPDFQGEDIRTRAEARAWIRKTLGVFGDAFLAHWERLHPDAEESR